MSSFKGAETSMYNIGWECQTEEAPDQELVGDLQTLRARSNKLIKDNLVIAGMQQAYLNNILSYGPTIYSASSNKIQREQINAYLEEKLDYIDITGTKSIYKVLEEIVSCSFADGDILINLPRIGEDSVVELIEAYRVDTPYGSTPSGMDIRHGVKYDSMGRVVGYYVHKPIPINTYHIRYSAEQYDFFPMFRESQGFRRRVTELFKAPLNSRPMASRQYPAVTPAITFIKNIDDFNEAVIIGARVSACFSAFVKTSNPAAAQKSMVTGDDPQGSGAKYNKMQPGSIFYLNRNEDVSFASPNKPGDNYDSFILRSYKTISMSFRIPYILAFLDTEQVSYSSWRGAVLDSFKLVKRWRRELNKILKWIISTIILDGMAEGRIRGSLETISLRFRWPSVGVLDQEKEERGNKMALENETKSKQMICDEQGADYEEVQADIDEERMRDIDREAKELLKKKEYEEKYGIIFPTTVQANDRDTTEDTETTDSSEEDKRNRRKEDGNW